MLNREPPPVRPAPPRRRGLTVILVVLFFASLTLRGLATLWTDLLWYRSVALGGVWSTLFGTTVLLAVVGIVVSFAVVYVNLRIANRIAPRYRLLELGIEEEVVERFQEWVGPRLARVHLGVAAVFAFLVGLGTTAWRDDVLLFFNREAFGIADPLYGNDVGFYVFQYPLIRAAFGWTLQLVILTFLVVATMHYLTGGIRIRQGTFPSVTPSVKVHLSVLGAFVALLKAVGYLLDRYDLLYSPRGVVWGASYTDINARLPALNLLILISLFAAVLLLWNIRRRGWTLPAVALGSWLVVSVVVGGIIPAAVQTLRVEPDELNKELPFIERNIEFTRQAYGLDAVDVRSFAASPDLTFEDIQRNRPTIDNVRLWDPEVLKDTYRQLQEIRTYYQLANVDVDRYFLDQETQVMVAARELDSDDLPAQGWVNEHLVFTHGFGAVVSPANAVNFETGQPVFLVKDIPPEATRPELEITQPRVYFGETYRPEEFVIVGTRQQEVDFPLTSEGESVEFTTYDGAGGVPAGNLAVRAAFALRFGDLNTLISNQLTGESKVLMVRNIQERIGRAMPFLIPDVDPYIVIVDGRLKWVQDLYSVTDRYPYSQPGITLRLSTTSELTRTSFNYLRNPVKAVVDAYDGTMTFYVVDDSDPLVRSYRRIFPEVFTDGSEMPDALREHLRYPEDLFRVQSDMYARYHMIDPRIFYSDEDPWQVPDDPSTAPRGERLLGELVATEFDPMLPYYLLMSLPDEPDLSYILAQPFNPLNRPNMASFMVAKSDPGAYGTLIDFRLPRGDFVDGPAQVGARINQNPEISQQFTLWNQQGSRVIQGDLLVVPIEESIVYFQPIYLQGNAAPLPEYKRVVVVFGDKIVMRERLDDALAEVFGGVVTAPGEEEPTPVSGTVAELLARAEALFAEADAALRRGDLGEYQDKIEEVQRLIQQAADLLGEGG